MKEIELSKPVKDAVRRTLTNIIMPHKSAKKKKSKPVDALYQLKITLIDSEPAIWRRIQVKDCTLHKLHEYIQAAMGWNNSHLHHFRIGKQLYGDPMLLAESFHELKYEDTTTTLLGDILPSNSKRFKFMYEYDFGDSWDHEMLFEGCPKVESGRKYPLCIEGERACPPEEMLGECIQLCQFSECDSGRRP